MKRFFATAGFSVIFSLLILNHYLSDFAFLYFSVMLCLFAGTLFFDKRTKRKYKLKEWSCIFLSCALAAISYMTVSELSYKPALEFAGKECEITADVLDLPTVSSGGNYSYLIKTKTINGEKKKIRMRLYTTYDICAEPYDEISFCSKPFVPSGDESALHEYFKSKRTYICAYTKREVLINEPQKKPLLTMILNRKGKSESNIRQYLDSDYSEFAISILFGDKAYLSVETKDKFSVSGLSHIMAVSGLHMSVWIMGLYFVLKKLRADRILRGIICIVASLILVCFCAFSVSIMRAALMLCLYFSAPFFDRRSDAFNSLGFAAFVICLINPYAVCDVSFLLSFFATLGIITFSYCFRFLDRFSRLPKPFSKIARYIVGTVCLCLSANLFTVPVLIRYFSSLSVFSPLANTAVSFLLSPCLLFAGALSVCPRINVIVFPIKTGLHLIEKYIFAVVSAVSTLPFSRLYSMSPLFVHLLPTVLTVGVTVLFMKKKKTFSPTFMTAALLPVLIIFS